MDSRATRDGWGDGLVEIGKKDERVVVLTADLSESTRVERFSELFPDRFIECGVAEQNMMGIAAGLAASGKIPFVSSYAVFSPGRNWEQLRAAVCYSNLPVKIGGGHTGLAIGADGATHQGLEDIAITRCLPNLTVDVPGDYFEAKKAVIEAVKLNGPVYIRHTKQNSALISGSGDKYRLGEAMVLAETGTEAAIVGCGPILNECLRAAKILGDSKVGVMVINCHTVKPLDRQTIVEAARLCQAVVTAEDHQIMGGMGSAVAEVLAGWCPVPMEFVGVADDFGESGTPDELRNKHGMTAERIVAAVLKAISRKSQLV